MNLGKAARIRTASLITIVVVTVAVFIVPVDVPLNTLESFMERNVRSMVFNLGTCEVRYTRARTRRLLKHVCECREKKDARMQDVRPFL